MIPGAPVPCKPSWDKTRHDALVIWDGKRLGDVTTPELVRGMIARKVPGASHEAGRAANVEALAAHIEAIHEAAGKAAVSAWLGA